MPLQWIGKLLFLGLNITLLGGCNSSILKQPTRDTINEFTFVLNSVIANKVEVAGSFNNWRAEATPMQRTASNRWSVTITLQPGIHQYQFVIDDKLWIPDPNATHSITDGFGNRNSILTVK
jgi:1,4-alpha-glucan branching enzyme